MRELRIGLVLYGGVSLGVYMNGVVTEIWQVLRASKLKRKSSNLGSTADIYREFLCAISRCSGVDDLRITVDTIAGSSAGGLAGIALGKAIATGTDPRSFNDAWLYKASIQRLVRSPPTANWCIRMIDWLMKHIPNFIVDCLALHFKLFELVRTIRDIREKVNSMRHITWEQLRDHAYSLLFIDSPNWSPLSDSYFTKTIIGTLQKMTRCHSNEALIPSRHRLDLVLSQTDLHGWERYLPVDPSSHMGLLRERVHAHRIQFSYQHPQGECKKPVNEFDDDFALTYAARTSASFPIVFTPACYESVANDYCAEESNHDKMSASPYRNKEDQDEFFRRYLPEHGLQCLDPRLVWMIDGGVLDNKPFSDVIRLIEEKPADRSVCRVLMYIEPNPPYTDGKLSAPIGHSEEKPMPLGPKQLAGLLYNLFRHEPIQADLQAISSRNKTVNILRKIAEIVEAEVDKKFRKNGSNPSLDNPQKTPEPRNLYNDMARSSKRESNYLGYTILRTNRVVISVANYVSDGLCYPFESEYRQLWHEVICEWLQLKIARDPPRWDNDDKIYKVSEIQEKLLQNFDVSYRLRCLRNIVRVVNELYGREEAKAATLDGIKRDLLTIELQLNQLIEVDKTTREEFKDTELTRDFTIGNFDCEIRALSKCKTSAAVIAKKCLNKFDRLYEILCKNFQPIENIDEDLRKIISSIPSDSTNVFESIWRSYILYPIVDQSVFPLMDSTGVNDYTIIRVVRVSPNDGETMREANWGLKGRRMGGFGGFFSKDARLHDLLWGRIDGAERLLDQIIQVVESIGHPKDPGELKSLRSKFRQKAVKIIIDEFRTMKNLENYPDTCKLIRTLTNAQSIGVQN